MTDDDGLLFARIVIERRATEDGTAWDDVSTEDEFGEPLDLGIALGLMRLAEHRLMVETKEGEG